MGSSDDPVGQLSPQDWLNDPATQDVMAALSAKGGEVRFVGGCVRDALMKRPVQDIDLATPYTPQTVMALLAERGIKTIPTGIAHGTVTALQGGRSFEITTLRRDVETDGRHARVAFTHSWREDAARRDFTINTLSADIQGRIWDYYDGISDLAGRRVRFVGDAETRIKEDILRILRFFRFNAHYGLGAPDKIGLDACRILAPRLTELSAERISTELYKILIATDPSPIITIMYADGIFTPILPDIEHPDRLKVLIWLESRALSRPTIAPDWLRRLASLLPPDRNIARAVGLRLHLSHAQTERLGAIAAGWQRTTPDLEPRELRRLLHRLGPNLIRDRLLIAWADFRRVEATISTTQTARWIAILDQIDQWQPVRFPLRGQDLLDLGLSPGPTMGILLDSLELWWEENDYQPDRQACLDRLKAQAYIL